MQLMGGIFYLLSKILFSRGERARLKQHDPQKWRTWAWICYMIGLVPWVVIFVWGRNWIAASVEASALPSMILGLVVAMRNGDVTRSPKWLRKLTLVFIPVGFFISLYDFGGITTINQYLEIGIVTGYIMGTYLLAKENAHGYLWLVPMHLSCGYLMWIQSYEWLTLQQILSLAFVGDAYRISRRERFNRLQAS